MIRPFTHEDLPAFVSLYAEIDAYDPSRSTVGYENFFARVLLDDPELTDPELPSYVYEDDERGVVGVMGCHPRRYLLGERRLRLACAGPLIVHPDFRPKGIGATLMRQFAAGAQEMGFNDRSVDSVHAMWRLVGAISDGLASIEWTRTLAPLGQATSRAARRAARRGTVPGSAAVAKVSRGIGKAGPAAPGEGGTEELTHAGLIELLDRLGRQYRLRPDFTPAYLDSIFDLMGKTVLGDTVLRRLVRDEAGRPIGACVAIVARHGTANVQSIVTAPKDARLVLEHLFHDAAAASAVEIAGRCDMAIQAELAGLGCRLRQGQWVTVRSADQELVNLALSAKALVSRMEGEWWMRPHPRVA